MRAPISLPPVRQSQPVADLDVAGFFTSQVFLLRNTDYQPEGGCLRSNYEKTQNPHRLTIGRPPVDVLKPDRAHRECRCDLGLPRVRRRTFSWQLSGRPLRTAGIFQSPRAGPVSLSQRLLSRSRMVSLAHVLSPESFPSYLLNKLRNNWTKSAERSMRAASYRPVGLRCAADLRFASFRLHHRSNIDSVRTPVTPLSFFLLTRQGLLIPSRELLQIPSRPTSP